jgi:hypothetical protein
LQKREKEYWTMPSKNPHKWRRFALVFILCAIAALPFSPSIHALLTTGGLCFGSSQPPGESSADCLVQLAVISPFAYAVGPLSSVDTDDPEGLMREIWAQVALVALAIGFVCALVNAAWRHRVKRLAQDEPAREGV